MSRADEIQMARLQSSHRRAWQQVDKAKNRGAGAEELSDLTGQAGDILISMKNLSEKVYDRQCRVEGLTPRQWDDKLAAIGKDYDEQRHHQLSRYRAMGR